MKRQRPVVVDLNLTFEAPELLARCPTNVTRDTAKRLRDLEDVILSIRRYGPPPKKRITKTERSEALKKWYATYATPVQKITYQQIALNKSLDLARKYLMEQFLEECPEYREPEKRWGRPVGYVPEETQRKIARGEIIARLLNIGYDELLKDLEGVKKSAQR
jgi:hypothetical protein